MQRISKINNSTIHTCLRQPCLINSKMRANFSWIASCHQTTSSKWKIKESLLFNDRRCIWGKWFKIRREYQLPQDKRFSTWVWKIESLVGLVWKHNENGVKWSALRQVEESSVWQPTSPLHLYQTNTPFHWPILTRQFCPCFELYLTDASDAFAV